MPAFEGFPLRRAPVPGDTFIGEAFFQVFVPNLLVLLRGVLHSFEARIPAWYGSGRYHKRKLLASYLRVPKLVQIPIYFTCEFGLVMKFTKHVLKY